MNVIVFDFDGVLCDSKLECMTAGYNTFQRFFDHAHQYDPMDQDYAQKFLQIRPFLRKGVEYPIIYHLIERKLTVKNQKDFDMHIDSLKDKLEDLNKVFHEERDKLRKDFNCWLELNPLYEGIYQCVQDIINNYKTYIATTKHSKYVLDILTHNNIFIPESNIIGCDKNPSKIDSLITIVKKEETDFPNIHFIDDQVDYLLRANDLGIKCYLAAWGYNNDEQRYQAAQTNIKIMKLEDLGEFCG